MLAILLSLVGRVGILVSFGGNFHFADTTEAKCHAEL